MTSANGATLSKDEQALSLEIQSLIANALMSREEMLKRFIEPDARRNVNRECGYPDSDDVDLFQSLFDRETIPNRAVSLLPKECWQVTPEVYEDEDEATTTEFEEAWANVDRNIRGLRSWHKEEGSKPIWEYLKRLDIQSGIGHFGVLLLGLDDVKVRPVQDGDNYDSGARYSAGTSLSQPLAGVEEYQLAALLVDPRPVKRPSTRPRLIFARVFPESMIQITRYETNRASPRYGQPVEYRLLMHDPSDTPDQSAGPVYAFETVHWTRLIHVADNLGSSEWSGTPRLRPMLNRGLDLRKLYGSSAEGFWQACFTAISLETNPALGGNVKVDKDKVREMMEDFRNGLQRYLALIGMSAKTLAPQVVDPSPQIERQIEAICIHLGCPVRIFKGSERGELASSQDDVAWNDRLKERQSNFITPRIIAPFIDRLIAAGVLPEPADGYKIYWPDLTSQSDQEKAAVALTKTRVLTAYVSGGGEQLYTPMDFLTKFMGETQESAEAILAAAEEAQAEQQEERAALADEHGMIPEAPPGFKPPEPPPPPPGPIEVEPGEKLVAPPTQNTETGEAPLGVEPADNVFCATGPGGGVDPSCGGTGGGGSGSDGGGAKETAKTAAPAPPKDHAEALDRLRRSEAHKQFLADTSGGMRGPQDAYQGALTKEMGADGQPKVVEKHEVDAAIKAGGIEGFRGLTDPKFVEDFRTGEMFHGRGIYGNGTYIAYAKPGAKDDHTSGGKLNQFDESKGKVAGEVGSRAYAAGVAAMFAGKDGAAARMVIDPSAKVGEYDKIERGRDDFLKEIDKKIGEKAGMFGGIFAGKAVKAELNELRQTRKLYEGDKGIGRYALTMGYDAYTHAEVGYAVVLNRSKVIVEKGDYYHKGNVQ